jgi:TetR/AcrR family transcriptional regulator
MVDRCHPGGSRLPSERSNGARSNVSEQIVKQATRLFAARGFFGASLRDIAKAVGIRKPSLLYHFPSKDELRQSVLEQMLARWNEAVPKLLRAATSGHEQFDAILQETIKFFCADPDRARLLLRELLDRPAEMAPLIEEHVEPWARIVSDYIRKGQDQGRVRKDVDPEAYIMSVINLVLCGIAIHGLTNQLLPPTQRTDAPPSVPQRYLDEMLRIAKSSLFVTPMES